MTGDADSFALWLKHDQDAQRVEHDPEVQLELEVDEPEAEHEDQVAA